LLLLPLYIAIAKLHLIDQVLGLMVFYTSTAAAILRVADERVLRHDPGIARGGGPDRRLRTRGTAFWGRVILPLRCR